MLPYSSCRAFFCSLVFGSMLPGPSWVLFRQRVRFAYALVFIVLREGVLRVLTVRCVVDCLSFVWPFRCGPPPNSFVRPRCPHLGSPFGLVSACLRSACAASLPQLKRPWFVSPFFLFIFAHTQIDVAGAVSFATDANWLLLTLPARGRGE